MSRTRRERTKIELKQFVLPRTYPKEDFDYDTAKISALIPTYKPGPLTLRLVEDLVRWDPNVDIYLIDDSTPTTCTESHAYYLRSGTVSSRVTLLRTPKNALKAGALNYGLKHIFAVQKNKLPEVILTLDDDVVITRDTIKNLVIELMSSAELGAVCSQCRVLNKNKNTLTRLQGLEYLGFNATRLADEGFFRGPLVMHGMLTAFRTEALRTVRSFAEGHLIEDYEITARLKSSGWVVKTAVSSEAWTVVPDSFGKLWKQRTRWSYGGVVVINNVRYLPSVMQDLIGHGMFWMTIILLDVLIMSSIFGRGGSLSPEIPYAIIALSVFQLIVWYVFQLWLMRLYKDKDAYDWLLRLALVPEFLYTNVLTVILIGSYLFLFFNAVTRSVTRRSHAFARSAVAFGQALFRACGYTKSWGTRTT
ncbi:glycosyltransferase family 2 protein [Candidatus Parcubacteria bacterium]|nr:MAG: glycosyltransferase family 2 protein [Candidatus Parcubacteria bacterium]